MGKKLRYILIGFIIGLIIATLMGIDSGGLSKIFFASYFVINFFLPCSGEGCWENAILAMIFWPLFGLIVGWIIGKIKSRKETAPTSIKTSTVEVQQ